MKKPKAIKKPILFPISKLQAIDFEASLGRTRVPRNGDQQALVLTANLVIALESEMARIFGSKPGDGTSPLDHERACYVHSLKAFSDFFGRLGVQTYGRHFHRLARVLLDVSDNKIDPLVRVAGGGTKPHDPSSLWWARAQVSLGMAALRRTGLNRSAAAKKAAQDFPNIKKLTGAANRLEPSSTVTKILTWFDKFTSGKVANSYAQAVFTSGKQDIEKRCGDDPKRLRAVANKLFCAAVQIVG